MKCQAYPCESSEATTRAHDCFGKNRCSEPAYSHMNSNHEQRCHGCAYAGALVMCEAAGRRELHVSEYLNRGTASAADIYESDYEEIDDTEEK